MLKFYNLESRNISKIRTYFIGLYNIAKSNKDRLAVELCIQKRLSEINHYIGNLNMQIYFAGVKINEDKEMVLHLFIRCSSKQELLKHMDKFVLIALALELKKFGITKFYRGEFYRLEGPFIKDK
jgi:hypothetical protein